MKWSPAAVPTERTLSRGIGADFGAYVPENWARNAVVMVAAVLVSGGLNKYPEAACTHGYGMACEN